jgi:PleD family two-component response regulator
MPDLRIFRPSAASGPKSPRAASNLRSYSAVVYVVDDSVVDANASVSLGLIITELCKNCVILVVEDIPLIRMGAVDLLVDAGFEVLEAGSPDEAIGILEARPDTHLVFTDVGMAGTMDGIKLSRYTRIQ